MILNPELPTIEEPMFEPARQNKTTDIIIEKIRGAILEGKLRPGDRLPPEKELGEQFNVSKQTMRESLRALEYMGLITMRKGAGGGAFIVEVEKEVAVQNLANYLYFKNLSIENLSETRRILEPYAARCAVRRMGDSDLELIREINALTEESIHRKNWQQVSRPDGQSDPHPGHRFCGEPPRGLQNDSQAGQRLHALGTRFPPTDLRCDQRPERGAGGCRDGTSCHPG